jgi:hypothetical protein
MSGGEWSPFLDGRADLQKYETACIKLENFRPLPWGGATYRPGLDFAGLASSGSLPCRLIPFNYSTTLSYVLELGNNYIRFWNSNGTQVMSGGNPYQIASPWTTAQIFQLQFKQINAQMRFVHPSVPPQTLTYASAASWSIAATSFKYPVLLDQNGVQSILLNVGALSGSTTLISNTPGIFNAGHVGSYWELQQLSPSNSQILDLNNQTIGVTVYSSNIAMQGDWSFTTSQFWWGEVQVQRSLDGGSTWTVIRDFTAKSDQNYSTSGTESPPNIGYPAVLYRIAFTKAGAPFDPAIWVGSTPSQYAYAQASLESQDAFVAGLVLVTAFTDSQHVTCTVILPPVSTAGTYLWSEGAFSAYRGYPSTIAFYEQRLLYSGTAFQPNTVWGSVTSDFDNFQYSSNDDGAVAFQPAVAQQNQAAWIATLLRIHLGTSGEEIIMASGNLDEALTPSNVTMRAQSYYGSAPIQPMLLQNSILFIERNGLRVREMRELSPYIVPTDFIAPDLTLMAEHVTQPGLVAMDFGRLPDPLAYFIRSDGVLPVMTYNREQNIMAWARYVTQGNFESVACIYGAPADEVWVSVKRVLNGATVRTIEIFTIDPAEYPNIQSNLLLDCATQFLAGVTNPTTNTSFTAGATQVTGLTWLEGVTVTAVIDGAEYSGLTVGNTGTLVFPPNVYAQSVVNVGLPYTGYLTPMKPVMQDQEGTSQGRQVRVSEIILRVRSSVSVEFAGSQNPTTWQELQFRSPGDVTGSMTPLSTTNQDGTANANGIADFPLPGPWPDGNDFSGQINLRQAHPFPLTIIGIFTKWDVL